MTGATGVAVQHNGRVKLVGLRTSLPVKEITEPPPPPTIVNHYHGPVFVEAVHSAQLAWNNTNVIQQQTNQNDESNESNESDQDGVGR